MNHHELNTQVETSQKSPVIKQWMELADWSPTQKNKHMCQEMEFPAGLEGYLDPKPIKQVQNTIEVAKPASYLAYDQEGLQAIKQTQRSLMSETTLTRSSQSLIQICEKRIEGGT